MRPCLDLTTVSVGLAKLYSDPLFFGKQYPVPRLGSDFRLILLQNRYITRGS